MSDLYNDFDKLTPFVRWEALATFIVYWTPYSRQIKIYNRIANAMVQFV